MINDHSSPKSDNFPSKVCPFPHNRSFNHISLTFSLTKMIYALFSKFEVVVGVDDGSPPVALTQSSFCKLATGFGATLHCQARSEKQRLLYDWTFTMGYYRHRLWHCTMLSSLSRPCLASPSCYSSSPPHKCFFKKTCN